MPKTKTAKILIYMLSKSHGWGAHVWYRKTDHFNDVFLDKRDAMREAIAIAKAHGFTHALILEYYGRLNQKPYKVKL